MSYGLFGCIIATPGQGDTLADYLLEAAEGLGHVEGCLLYVVNRDADNADAVWVYEAWRSSADHQASLQLEATQTLIAKARPIIAEMATRFELHPAGGKGLPTG